MQSSVWEKKNLVNLFSINYKSIKSTISRYYNCFKKPSSQLEAILGVFEIWNIQVKSWNDSGYLREINEI